MDKQVIFEKEEIKKQTELLEALIKQQKRFIDLTLGDRGIEGETRNNMWKNSENVQFKDKLVRISFDCLKNIKIEDDTKIEEQLKVPINVYINNILKRLSDEAFYVYSSEPKQQLVTQNQVKAFVCKNLILNYYQLLRYFKQQYNHLWDLYHSQFISLFNKQLTKSLGYFNLKYPNTNKIYINDNLVQKQISFFDNSQVNIGHVFRSINKREFASFGKYILGDRELDESFVKKLINEIIKQTKTKFDSFRSFMVSIFGIKSQKPIGKHHLIGSKLPTNLDQYSEEEINKKGIDIKTPQVRRLILKWIQKLEKTIETIKVKTKDFYQPQNVQESIKVQRSMQIKIKIQKELENYQNLFDTQSETYLNHIQSLVSQTENKYKDYFSFLPESDLKIGLFTSFLCKSLDEVACKKLLKLLKQFRNYFITLKTIPFQVFDLFRAKVFGSFQQLSFIIRRLRNQYQHFSIVKVNNRLHSVNSDILVNFTMRDCAFVCELQLVLVDRQTSLKSDCYSHFNHFLYELQRCNYGGICESVSIISNLQSHFSYFSIQNLNKLTKAKNITITNLLKQSLKIQTIDNKYNLSLQGYTISSPLFNFICNNCYQYKQIFNSWLPSASTKNVQICGKCLIENLVPDQKELFILNIESASVFKEISFKQLVNAKPNYVILVKDGDQKVVTAYKKYKDYVDYTQYFKCMLGLKGNFANSNNKAAEILTLKKDDKMVKQFLNNTFIFALNKEVEIKTIKSQKELDRFDDKSIDYYRTVLDKTKKLQKQQLKFEDSNEKQYIFTIAQSKGKLFLLDIEGESFGQFVERYLKQYNIKQLLRLMYKTGQDKLDIVGNYGQQCFEVLNTAKDSIQNLYCKIENMKQIPELIMQKLSKVTLIITQPQSILDIKNLQKSPLTSLIIQLRHGQVKLQNSNLEQLKTFKIKGQTIESLDFSSLKLKSLKTLAIEVQVLIQFKGFQQNCDKRCEAKDIVLFSLIVNDGPLLDLYHFQHNENLTYFHCSNGSKFIKYKIPFVDVENYQFKAIIIQLRQQGSRYRDLQQYVETLHIIGSKSRRISFNKRLYSLKTLKIQYGIVEQIYCTNYQFQKLTSFRVYMTKLSKIEISWHCLPSVTEFHFQCNYIEQCRVWGSQNLNSINLSYNKNYKNIFDYLSQFLSQIPLKVQNQQRINQYVLTQFTDSQFQKFKTFFHQQHPSISPFSQQDILFNKIGLSKDAETVMNAIYGFDLSGFETTKKIMEANREVYEKIIQFVKQNVKR